MRLLFICILLLNLLIISKCDVYVPWREQVTVYCCGDASFQMTYLSYFPNANISQYEIVDTARTTNTSGTWVVDLQRIAHFSNVSSAPKIQAYPFPNDVPKKGWNEVNYLGMGGFVHRAKQCWFGDLVKVIKQGFPLIVLNWFSETTHDGHFRVAFGYDDVTKELLLNDPWGRQGQPHVLRVNETVFCVLWSHFEKLYNYSYDPYTAILISPWEVKAKAFRSNGRIFINSTIQYHAPYPFSIDADVYTAKNSLAVLSVSQRNSTHQFSQSFENPIGFVSPNKVYEANFNIVDTGDIVEMEIVAYGTVYGSLPQVPGWINGTNYPGYSYSDNIGGRVSIKI